MLNWYNDIIWGYSSFLGEAYFMKSKLKIFTLMVGVCFTLSALLFAFENKADESLAKGKRLFADGRYEEAMDSFIDVFVTGNTDQIAEANEYVNLIHFDRGGVVAPKQVPYDAELEKRQNLGVQGSTLSKKPKKQSKSYESVSEESLTEVLVNGGDEDPFDSSDSDSEDNSSASDGSDGFDSASGNDINQAKSGSSSQDESFQDEEGFQDEEEGFAQSGSEKDNSDEIIPEETSFPKGSKSKVRALQKEKEEKQRRELIDYIIDQLNANEDVQVYMRAGRVDAVDINSAAIFQGSKIDKTATSILDNVYALMILENSPLYVILPEGSYTDDVTLHGVRQAVALNSYLINRGMSASRLNLNMGLTNQEPPEKFSNLAGISIVFDYKGKSHLKSKLEEKNLPPVLSLATYPFKEITPTADEVFVIDFSVMEATAPVKEWVLQIVSHAADDHYYVVKQLSGNSPLNYQTFWNGHKRYFGQLLPYGKYTVVLRGTDIEGRESILKRQLILKEPPEREDLVIMKTESEVVKSETLKKIKEEQAAKKSKTARTWSETSDLDYSQKRLWTKPGRRQVGQVTEEIVETTETVTESAPIVSTSSQKTVYQETTVVDDSGNTSNYQETVTTSGEENNSYGATGNPYETTGNPYETTGNPYETTGAGEESNPYGF